MIGRFGKKQFQVNAKKVMTFRDLSYMSSLKTEKQEMSGRKPSTIIGSSDLDGIKMKLQLRKDLGINPQKEWDSWMILLKNAAAQAFVLGERVMGRFLLVAVAAEQMQLDAQGSLFAVDLTLSFEEYVRKGAAKKKITSNSAKGLRPSSTSDRASLTPTDTYGLTAQEKSDKKRANANLQRLYNDQ